MAYVIPQPIVTYTNPLQPLPSRVFLEPREGRFVVPVEIDWDGKAGGTSTVLVNVNGNTTQPVSQIVMLDVDNTANGSPVSFYFADTVDTLTVSGGEAGLFPVFTQQLQFYVSSPAAFATDITRLRVLNYRQEPVANPAPNFTEIATALNIAAAGTVAILPATVSGTLVGYSVNFSGAASGAAASAWTGRLIDHTSGMVIDGASAFAPQNGFFSGLILNVEGIAVRFAGGIDFVTTIGAAWASLAANVSIRYRQP